MSSSSCNVYRSNPKTRFWSFRFGTPQFSFLVECGSCPRCAARMLNEGAEITLPLTRVAICSRDKQPYYPTLSIGIDLGESTLMTAKKRRIIKGFMHAYKDVCPLYNKSFLGNQLYAWGSSGIPSSEFKTIEFDGKSLHKDRPDLYYNLFYYVKLLSVSNDEELSSYIQNSFPDFKSVGARVICTGFY